MCEKWEYHEEMELFLLRITRTTCNPLPKLYKPFISSTELGLQEITDHEADGEH